MGFPPAKPRRTIPHWLRFENLARTAPLLPGVGLAIAYGLLSSGFTKLRVPGSVMPQELFAVEFPERAPVQPFDL